jgi:phosphatidyl-myo-inositol dimannoside synthase
MRVLLVGPGFQLPGGIQYIGHLMAEGLRASYGSDLELHAVGLLDSDDCPLAFVPASWSGARGKRMQLIRSIREAVRKRPDVVLINHVNLLPLFAAASIGLKTRSVIVVMHGIEAWRALRWPRTSGLSRVSRFLFVSDFTRRRTIQVNPHLGEVRSGVCHHGLLPNALARDSQGMSESSGPPFVLMIGRMSSGERYKGFEEMILAWPEVREHRPDLDLVIVGGGDDQQRLAKIAAESGPGIRFAGQVPDSERDRLIQTCTAFALPSRGEGFGLVYLEAMKCSKPVLAGALDAGGEVIVDGVTGRAVDASDSGQVVDAVLQLTSNAGTAMGEAGRRRYEENFTFERYAARFRSFIDDVSMATGLKASSSSSCAASPAS